jgi:hypothetical protein
MHLIVGAALNRYTPQNKSTFDITLDKPEFLAIILNQLAIPIEEVQLVIRNNQMVNFQNLEVEDQDLIIIYPYVTGG